MARNDENKIIWCQSIISLVLNATNAKNKIDKNKTIDQSEPQERNFVQNVRACPHRRSSVWEFQLLVCSFSLQSIKERIV